MEVALQEAKTLVVVDDEARLAHALRLARGFALFFVRCNVPFYRAEVVARLKRMLPRPIVEVNLTDEPEVYPAIARAAETSPHPSVIFIYGLEAHLPSADRERAFQTLRGLNWRRAAYQRLARPLVFWLPEYALGLVAREAPDFYDWNSGVFELAVPEPVREAVLVEALVPEGEPFSSLPVEKKESRLRLLEGLWEEYGEEHPAEQQARLRLALQLGDLNDSLGRYEEARRWLTEAWRLADALGDRRSKAQTLGNLGNVYAHQGRWEEAIRMYGQALDIFRALGDPHGEGQTLGNLGVLAQDQGDWAEARRLYEESLRIAERLGDRAGVAQTLHRLGLLAQAQGDLEGAMELYRESLAIREYLGDLRGKAATLHEMAYIHRVRGDLEGAMGLYRESLAIEESLGDLRGKAATLHEMAYIHRVRGDLEGAMELYRESLAIREYLGDLRGKAATLAMMGQVLLAQGQALEGIRALQQALEILAGMGARADAQRVAEILEYAQRAVGVAHE